MSEQTRVTGFQIRLGGETVSERDLEAWVVEQDVNQPDMCVVTLHDMEHKYSNDVELGAQLEVKVTKERGEEKLFTGEVVGLEPIYKAGGESLCVVRGFNRLHRLLRGRHSRTYVDQTDKDIAEAVANENGLRAECDSTPNQYEHVYQHNQSDLEFLRERAARVGFEVMVRDRVLHFRKPRRDVDSGLELKLNAPQAPMPMLSFSPRMSSAGVVGKVEVRGWNPVEKKEIVGVYEGSRSPLGNDPGYDKAKDAFGETVTYRVDAPIASVAEAEALAGARFFELSMDYITGEAQCLGHPELAAGKVVKIVVNPDRDDDRFNGKYRIAGATHRYGHGGPGGGGGYITTLRVRRDAERG